MAFSVTGGKYAVATIASVGTTTLAVGTTPFVSADFGVLRMVGLWSSGSVFKGMTWARRWVSTSQLELEKPFFDPATGASVAQVVGDQVLISINFGDLGTTNVTPSPTGATITVNSAPTFGVAGNAMGCCFWDGNKVVVCPYNVSFSGGLTVFGKFEGSYATRVIDLGCNWLLNTTFASPGFQYQATDAQCNFVQYGGGFTTAAAPSYMGSSSAQPNTMIFDSVENYFDFVSPGSGGSWGTNKARAQLLNCKSICGNVTDIILVRWGDGIVTGGKYKYSQGASLPLSVFGTDVAGTYSIGAVPGDRSVVLDAGIGPALTRTGSSSLAVTFNYTNLITPDFRFAQNLRPLNPNPVGVNNFYFQDTYSNVQAGSVGVVTLDADGSVVSSAASTTGTTWSPTVYRRQYLGFTQQFVRGPWTYGIKKYGFAAVSGAIAASTYDLGTVGLADNVAFGGAVVQAADANVTLTLAGAQALATIATLDNVYDASIAWGVASVTNAKFPTLGTYPASGSGNVLSLGALNLVIDANASAAYAVNTSTSTVTIKASTLAAGAKFTNLITTGTITFANGSTTTALITGSAGSNGLVTITSLLPGSSVALIDSTGAVVQSIASSGTTATFVTAYPSTGTLTYVARRADQTQSTGIVQASGASSTAAAETSRAYYASAAVAGVTFAPSGTGGAAGTVTVGASITTAQLWSAWAQYVAAVANIAVADTWSYDGATLNIAGWTLSIGSGYVLTGNVQTTASVTGAGTISGTYTTQGGTSGQLTLTGLQAGSTIYIADASAAQQAFVATSVTSYTFTVPPGAPATWTWKVAKYGYLEVSNTFQSSGASSAVVAQVADVGITQPAVATVAAYTAIDTLDKLFDFDAYRQTTNNGIKFSRAVNRAGAAVDLGVRNLVVDASASAAWAVASGTITIAAATLSPGTTYSSLTTTGTVSIANGALLRLVYTSSAGTSGVLNLTGLQAGSTVYVTNGSGAQQAFTAATAGSTFTLYIPAAAAATWTWKVARYGFLETSGTFSTSGLANVPVVQAIDTGITQTNAATVGGYTTLETLDKLYDFAALRQTTVAGIAFARVVTKSGTTADLGVRNLVVDATATSPWAVAGGTITIAAAALAAGSTFQTLSTTGAVSTANGGVVLCVYTDNAGRHVKVTAAGLIAGTRVQLWNSTDGVEVDNSLVSGAAGYALPLIYTADKGYRLRATYANGTTAMLPLQAQGIFGLNGLAFSVAQAADAVYNGNGIDGSTASEFTADFPNVQVDVSASGGATTVQRLYAWLVWEQTMASGIRNFYGSVAASDTANYVIDQSVVGLQLDNVLSTPVRVTGGYLTRKDGSTVIAPTSGSIQMDPGKAYVAAGSGTGTAPGAITIPPGYRVITLSPSGKQLARS